MAKSKNRQKDLDYEVRKRKIFLIVFEKTNCVFVNSSCQKNMLKLYEEHFREKYVSTKQAFSESKQAGITPPIYLLEEVEGTNSDAFQHIISWLRYFSEHGYGCLTSEKVIQIVDTSEESSHFQSIKCIPIDIICAPGKDLFPNFGAKKRRESDKERPQNGQRNLSLSLSEEEYQMVRKLSREASISMREFIVNCLDEKAGIGLVNSVQMEKYLQEIDRYFHTVNALRWEFQGLVNSILCAKKYELRDIQAMYAICQATLKSNDKLEKEIQQFYQQLRRMKKW